MCRVDTVVYPGANSRSAVVFKEIKIIPLHHAPAYVKSGLHAYTKNHEVGSESVESDSGVEDRGIDSAFDSLKVLIDEEIGYGKNKRFLPELDPVPEGMMINF